MAKGGDVQIRSDTLHRERAGDTASASGASIFVRRFEGRLSAGEEPR